MRRKSCAILLLLFFGAALRCASAEDIHYSFTTLSIEDGLSSPTVRSIFKDREGSMWVGTKEDLNRFSAAGHSTFHLNGEVKSLSEDSEGRLWAGTRSGIYIYDRSEDSFKALSNGVVGNCDSMGDEMWVSNYNTLYRFDIGNPDNPQYYEFPSNIDIRDILSCSDGQVLLGTRTGGIWSFDRNSGNIARFCREDINEISCMMEIGDRIFVGTKGEGVIIYDREGTMCGTLEGLPSRYVTDMAFQDGKVWICTDGAGVTIVDIDTMEATVLRHISGDSGSLPTDAIYTIYAEDDGSVWLGTVRYGLINVSKHYIKTYRESALGGVTGLSERCAISLFRDADGMVWIGTDGQGICRFNPADESFVHYPETYGDYIPSIAGYDRDRLLVTGFHKGIFYFDKDKGKYSSFKIAGKSADEGEWNAEYIQKIVCPGNGKVFTFGSRSFVHNPHDGTSVQLTFENGAPATWASPLWYNGDLVMAAIGNTLYVNRLDDKILHELCNVGSCGNIQRAAFDRKNGRIWIAAAQSFGYVDLISDTGRAGGFRSIQQPPFTKVTHIVVDGKGKVWVSADMQLFLYDPEKDLFRIFGVYDGFDRNDILTEVGTEIDGDIFYLAGTSGFVSVNTGLADMLVRDASPRMYLTEIVCSKKRTAFSKESEKSAKLPWNHGAITVNYAVPEMNFNENALFTYVLEGKDRSVITSRSASLGIAALSPGEYTLTASCNTASGSLVTVYETAKITVLKPWFKTTWFNIIILLAVFGLLTYGLYKYIMATSAKSGIVESAISDKDRLFLDKFNALVENNIDKPDLSPDFFTKELAISRSGLYDKIKMLTGYSLNEYIKRTRINKAVDMLKNTDMNISEISDATGFSYPRYFSEVFKELTGSSPSQFRKTYRSEE